MTAKERRLPNVIKASRKKRISAGSGMKIADVNKLLKQHQQMETMMKRMKKMGGPSALANLMSGSAGGPGRPGGAIGGSMPPIPGGPPLGRK